MPDTVVLTCAHLLIGGYDFSAQFQELMVTPGAEMLDASSFGSDYRKKKGGIQTGTITGKGKLNLGSSLIDPVLFGKVGVGGDIMTAFFDGITAGSTVAAFSMNALSVKYNLGGTFGTLLSFDVEGQSQSRLVPAVVLDNAMVSAWSTDSSGGTVVHLPSCSVSSEMLYGGFHVTALSTGLGVTITGTITANSSSGYSGSNPLGTTRLSFVAQSCKAGTFAVPIPASSLSSDQPFYRSLIVLSTGTSTGPSASGLLFMGLETF